MSNLNDDSDFLNKNIGALESQDGPDVSDNTVHEITIPANPVDSTAETETETFDVETEEAEEEELVNSDSSDDCEDSDSSEGEMSKAMKIPDFISDTKNFEAYEKDLKIWSRLTNVKLENQAEWVVMSLEGHPSGIKEKAQLAIGTKLESNANGITEFLTFLKGIYQKDDFKQCYETYMEFEAMTRGPGEDIQEFINRWDMANIKLKTYDCVLPDKIKALKMLGAANITFSEHQLVMSGIDYKTAKDNCHGTD